MKELAAWKFRQIERLKTNLLHGFGIWHQSAVTEGPGITHQPFPAAYNPTGVGLDAGLRKSRLSLHILENKGGTRYEPSAPSQNLSYVDGLGAINIDVDPGHKPARASPELRDIE